MNETIQESSADQPPPPRAKPRRRGLRALVAAVITALTVAGIQRAAPETDFQNANLLSMAVGLFGGLYILFQLHRAATQRGHRLAVPLATLAVVAFLVVYFRFDGFSGEMLPQFTRRFASPPPLRALADSKSEASAATDAAAASSSGDVPEAVAANSFSGFLGNRRDGVLPDREFAIPSQAAAVKQLWNQGIGEGWSSFAVSGDRAVTLEQREGQECVTCYRLIDGELVWMQSHTARHEHPLGGVGPRSTPTIEGDRVFAQGATGTVWCLDLESGEPHWTVDLLEMAGWDQAESEAAIAWGRAGSPLWVDGLCVVPYGGPDLNATTGRSLIALDAESGGVRWAAGEDQISYASPRLFDLGGVRQIVSVNEQTISGHRIDDGQVLWTFAWFGQSNAGASCSMAIPAGTNRFLIGKGYGGGSALVHVRPDESGDFTAEAVWESNSVLKTKFTHACVDGEVAYALSNGSLEAVRVEDGELLWRQPRSSRFGQGQILLVQDTIVAQTEPGDVVLVEATPEAYRELIRIPALDAKTWNIPTVAGRHLLVRNDRRAICFFLPSK